MLEKSKRYGVNFRKEPMNATRYKREQEDFKVKYTEIIEKLGNRYNILLNEKIRDIKLFYIQEFKVLYLKLEKEKSNIKRGDLIIHLDKRVERRIRILTDWLKDMQFIWSFFTVNNTRFRLEDSNLDLIPNISTNRDLLEKPLDDIDREIEEILLKKYNFTEESRGTHGGRRDTQRKRTPRRRKVVQTRKKRY
jgi:hypothetical protein